MGGDRFDKRDWFATFLAYGTHFMCKSTIGLSMLFPRVGNRLSSLGIKGLRMRPHGVIKL